MSQAVDKTDACQGPDSGCYHARETGNSCGHGNSMRMMLTENDPEPGDER